MPEPDAIARRTRRGYLILGALLLAALLIFNVDAVIDLTRGHLDLVALVHRAEGVREGSAVWVAGVESGRVTRVGFAGPRAATGTEADSLTIAVRVRLDPETRRVITRRSDVRATRIRFIAEPVVQIDAGEAGDPPVEDGDTLYGSVTPDPLQLLETAATLPAGLDSLVHAVRRIQAMADDRAPEIRLVTRRLADATASAAALSVRLEGGSLGLMLDPERGVAARLTDLDARLDGLAAAAQHVVERYAPGGEDAALPSAAMDLMRRVQALQGELETLRARFADGGGFLPRVQRDSALIVAVRGVQAQIDSLTAEAASIGLRMLLP